jgi:hypothetical protein
MNVLELYTTESPYGKEDECAKLSIFDTAEWFILSDTTTVGLVYTFSAWIKSDADGSFTVGESYIRTSTKWVRYKATFTADDVDLKLIFSTPGTYYLYNTKLEIGTLATDWTPSPEDVSESVDGVRADMVEKDAEILESCSELINSMMGSYVNGSEYLEFKETIASELAIRDDAIDMTFTVLEGSIQEIDGTVQAELDELTKNISHDGSGITVSDSDKVYEIQVDNVEGVTIRKNGEIRSQLVDDDFYTGNIHVEVNERARFGNFAFVPRSDGSLSFLKVGD